MAETGEGKVSAEAASQIFRNQNVERGRQRTALTDTSGKGNWFREKTINHDSGRGLSVQEANPRNKHGAKTYSLEDPEHISPVNPVKGIGDCVLEKTDIFAYETPRNRARLVRRDDMMYNFAELKCECPRGNLIVNV